MQKNTIYILVAVALLVAVYVYMKSQKDKAQAQAQAQEQAQEQEQAPVKKTTTKPTSATTTGKGVDRYKTLQVGSKGEEVKLVQKILNNFSLGKVKIDGVFGKGTEGWLVSYKSAKGIGGNPKTTSVMELNADNKGGGIFGGF